MDWGKVNENKEFTVAVKDPAGKAHNITVNHGASAKYCVNSIPTLKDRNFHLDLVKADGARKTLEPATWDHYPMEPGDSIELTPYIAGGRR